MALSKSYCPIGSNLHAFKATFIVELSYSCYLSQHETIAKCLGLMEVRSFVVYVLMEE